MVCLCEVPKNTSVSWSHRRCPCGPFPIGTLRFGIRSCHRHLLQHRPSIWKIKHVPNHQPDIYSHTHKMHTDKSFTRPITSWCSSKGTMEANSPWFCNPFKTQQFDDFFPWKTSVYRVFSNIFPRFPMNFPTCLPGPGHYSWLPDHVGGRLLQKNLGIPCKNGCL